MNMIRALLSDMGNKALYNLWLYYIDYLIGQDEDFDLIASSAVKRAIRNYAYSNTHFTLFYRI